ncbi:MAG: hypothetical protein ACP5NM_12170, partial [Thiomonas sp.]
STTSPQPSSRFGKCRSRSTLFTDKFLEAALLLAINWAPPVNAALATLAIPTRLAAAGPAGARDAPT